jgi:putative transposase
MRAFKVVSRLKANRIAISTYGRGCRRDNVFVERQWKSVKCEAAYSHACDSVSQAKAPLATCLALYNTRRPHSSPDRKTSDQVQSNQRLAMPKAG